MQLLHHFTSSGKVNAMDFRTLYTPTGILYLILYITTGTLYTPTGTMYIPTGILHIYYKNSVYSYRKFAYLHVILYITTGNLYTPKEFCISNSVYYYKNSVYSYNNFAYLYVILYIITTRGILHRISSEYHYKNFVYPYTHFVYYPLQETCTPQLSALGLHANTGYYYRKFVYCHTLQQEFCILLHILDNFQQ